MQDGTQESSVLFSLNELRSMEETRLEEERDAEAERLQAIERAKAEAQRQIAARQAAEAERVADEKRRAQLRLNELAAEDERRRRDAEMEQIMLEARLEAEAEARLQEVRRTAQAQADAAVRRASPVGKVAAVTVGALLFFGLTAVGLRKTDELQLERARAAAAAEAEHTQALKAQRAAEEQRVNQELDWLRQRLQANQPQPKKVAEREKSAEPRRHVARKAPAAKSAATVAEDAAVSAALLD